MSCTMRKPPISPPCTICGKYTNIAYIVYYIYRIIVIDNNYRKLILLSAFESNILDFRLYKKLCKFNKYICETLSINNIEQELYENYFH